MTKIDRRTVLGSATMAIAWPMLASVPVRAQPATGHFAPPADPMVYSRRLVRDLPRGASFAVTRRFAIRFEANEFGWRILGEQVGVEVLAPAPLDRFAEIERNRQEAGLFPIALDRRGQIAGSDIRRDEVALDAAILETRRQLSGIDYSAQERAEIEAYVTAVHRTASGLITELPADLFAPADTERKLEREVTLPGGESGRIRSAFHAISDPSTGLMREASREVVSELDGDSRRILESWHLGPSA